MKVKLLRKVRKRYSICIKEHDGKPCRFNVYDSKGSDKHNPENPIYSASFYSENKDKVFRDCLDVILSDVIDEWKFKLRPDKEYKVWWNK